MNAQAEEVLGLVSIFGDMELFRQENKEDKSKEAKDIMYEVIEGIFQSLRGYNEEQEQKWIDCTNELRNKVNTEENIDNCFAIWNEFGKLLLAQKIVLMVHEMNSLEAEAVNMLMDFLQASDLEVGLKASGIYKLAGFMVTKNPDFCYENTLKAFELYPQLGAMFKSEYIYDKKQIVESYQPDCPICDGKESFSYFCAQQLTFIGNDSKKSPVKLWKKCKTCGNLYSYNFPMMLIGEINGNYTKNVEDAVIYPRGFISIYGTIINKCREFTKGNRYLEIGIGEGEMLAAALEMGYEVDAVEICKEDCEKVSAALDLDITWCDFMKYDTEKKYDVIVMGDVLEHVSQPKKALEKAISYMSEGGLLWLSTPNYNSGFTQLRKHTDPMWNEVTHFTYFSYETLVPILQELGVEVKRYDISNRYRGSMELYIQAIK